MLTQIKKVGLANGIKCSGKSYTLPEMIQESYRVSYKAKELGDSVLINLTESHLMSVKKDPTNEMLSGDLEVLQKLAASGKKVRTAKVTESAKVKKSPEISWSSSKESLKEGLENFKKSAKSKVFYKELEKFSKSVASGKAFTMNEAVSLYKASNSCLTHLTVELEKQPNFIDTYNTCTNLLSKDNGKLLEAIQSKKVPDAKLLENYLVFTSILLECDAPEKPEDPEIDESVNLPEVEGEDVINEEVSGVSEEDDRDVINEDDDMTELDDKDVLNEGDEEACDNPEECPADEESLHEDASSDDVPVDLTIEEIRVLKSILSKIASMDETEGAPVEDEEIPAEDDLVPPDDVSDEEINEDDDIPVDEDIPLDGEDEEDPSEEEIPTEDDDLDEDEVYEEDPVEEEIPEEPVEEDIPVDEPVEDEYVEEPSVEEEVPEDDIDEEDEVATEDDLRSRLVQVKDDIDEVLENLPEKPEDEEDIDVSITEAIKNRIKKCF